jgi:hypothetical protein
MMTESPVDSVVGRVAKNVAFCVGLQCLVTLLTANSNHLLDEVLLTSLRCRKSFQ